MTTETRKPTTQEQVDRLIASVALRQHGNGTWSASVAAMNTIVAHGDSRDAAVASLRTKLTTVIGRR